MSRPEKCYIESSRGYVGGDYADGWFSAQIRDLGESYALAMDTVAPVVRWKTDFNGKKVSVLRCELMDSGSGVKSFKAYVDGRFVLFTSYRGSMDLPVERNAVASGGQTPPVDREGDGPLRE